MTKQVCATSEVSGEAALKQVQSQGDVLREKGKFREDAFTLKGLPLAEAYLEGFLWIAIKLSGLAWPESNGRVHWIVAKIADPDVGQRRAVIEHHLLDGHRIGSGDEHQVFVRDVELMDAIEMERATIEGLYLIEDHRLSFEAWRKSPLFMSLDGSFHRLPILPERKLGMSVDGIPPVLNEYTVRMIKGGPEVMERIAQDGGCMAGETDTYESATPSLTIALGAQSLHVLLHNRPENVFQIADVMVGPFGF